MGLGHYGLAISFAIMVVLLLTIFIRAKISDWMKFILIPMVIWYSLVLYSIPNNFAGWAVDSEPPDNTIIIGLWVSEPDTTSRGGIYFWGVKYPDTDQLIEFSLDPKKFVKYIETVAPRTYRIPYSAEFHKKLLEAKKQQKEKNGVLFYKKGMKPGKGNKKGNDEDDSGFILKDLEELLPKVTPGSEM